VAWVVGSALGTSPSASPAAAAPVFQLEQAHADYHPALDGSEPVFILVLGSDARPGEVVTGQRADSIHLLSINPAKQKASIIGFPRDSWVEIPGHGTDKINAAMTYGGPDLVVQTVEGLMGIKIGYWAMTWFDGFEAMINRIDGLTVDVPFPVHDPYSHADLEAGVQTLDGREALAFARARHALPSGDFGRSENQGLLIVSALAQFHKEFTSDPSRMFAWISAGLQNLRTDLSLDETMSLAFTSVGINPKHVQNVVMPGSDAMIGGLSVVELDQSALQAISTDIAPDGLLAKKNIPPSPNASLEG
jgi:LCP family protein required for cell wall assembly